MKEELKSIHFILAKKQQVKDFSNEYKDLELKLLREYDNLELSYKVGALVFAGVPKWYEIIDPILSLANSMIASCGLDNPNINNEEVTGSSRIMTIGSSLSKIGFPPERLEEYSQRIHKEIVQKTNDNPICLTFLEALSKQKDERTHKILQGYLRNHKNYFYETFQALINYADIEDLKIIEPYLTGSHVDIKTHSRSGDKELNKTAQSAYNKIKKSIEKSSKSLKI